MENKIKRSELKELEKIQFGIDAQYYAPGEQEAYLKGLGYSKEQIDIILDLVYWANIEEKADANEEKLLDAGWGIEDEDGITTMKVSSVSGTLESITTIPTIMAVNEIATNCIICGDAINLGYDNSISWPRVCDKCRAAILDLRATVKKKKEKANEKAKTTKGRKTTRQ